ncbi:MAG: hypothetical protein E7313_02525 [Clostridiales bacterium]|nr:hypothetical protein [Clostridiales bacterium]
MEYVEQQSIKKMCNFYVSDLHLSVMLIPYISKQIDKDVEVTTIFEEIDKKNFETILEKTNIKNKDKILNIKMFDNKKDTYDDIKKIFENTVNNKHTIIIAGNKDFILNNNKMIMSLLDRNKINIQEIKIVDCYNLENVESDVKNIVKEYNNILNTNGEKDI